MKTIGFASFVGSPGVTTWVTLAASAAATIAQETNSKISGVLLLEVDPSGSRIAYQYQLQEGSFLKLASELSNPSVDWRACAQTLPGGASVISVDGSAVTMSNLIESSLNMMLNFFGEDDSVLVIADLGRLFLGHPTLDCLECFDTLIVLLNRVNSDIVFSSRNLQDLIDIGSDVQVGWGVIGKNGQSNTAIKDFSGVEVLVEIPQDATGAAALFDHPSKWILRRSALSKASYEFASTLLESSDGSI